MWAMLHNLSFFIVLLSFIIFLSQPSKPKHRAAKFSSWEVHSSVSVGITHRLIRTDRMDLSPKHDGCEDQKEEALEAEEDEEDDGCWWREVTALWGEERKKFGTK